MKTSTATLALCLAAVCGGAFADDGPPRTIDRVDVSRYVGTWYEIAKFPNRFQRQCVGDTSATYATQPDGTLQVRNRCRVASGGFEEALGQARQVGGPESPKLKVRFAPAWLSWLPFVWGDYWIVDLDADYTLAAVTDPRREYAWVLSRTPQLDPARWDALLQRLAAQGLDVAQLEKTAHAPR